MAIATINETAYGKLLARALPRVIETQADNERMIAELEKLDTRARPLTPEEEKLAELMTVLIQQYEQAHYPIGHATPIEALRVLMEERGLRQRDLIPVFGSQQRGFRRAERQALDQQSSCSETRRFLPRPREPFHLVEQLVL